MKRILFVATLFSPIAARWVTQLADTQWDVHVFGTHREIHPLFHSDNVTVHAIHEPYSNCEVRVMHHRDLWPLPRGRTLLRRHFPRIANLLLPAPSDVLTKLINDLKPDIVHSLKMQNEAYLTLNAFYKSGLSVRPRWAYSVWGSDIYHNRNFPERLAKIEEVLPEIDYLLSDNPRDIALACEHGFRGEVLGVYPGGGGYPLLEMRKYVKQAPSHRRTIALKGYQAEHGGQALTALEGVRRCGKRFSGYRIVVHSAIGTYASAQVDEVQAVAREVSRQCDVPIDFLPFSPPETIWDLFARSRIALAISTTDGTPNAMLEAMSVGAFPSISTGGLEPWIDSGQNGYLVPPDDANAISSALIHAIENDTLVDTAAETNYRRTDEHLEYVRLRKKVLDMYEHILQSPRPFPRA